MVRAIRPLLEGRYDDAPARVGDLERLADTASAVEDLSAWLADLTLDPPVSSGDLAGPPHLDEDYLVISTIHSAKGLEWSHVHVPHVVDGAIPIDMALSTPEGLEEERRLFYVAVTRARDELHLYAPLRMPHHRFARNDRHSFAPLSRFLDDDVRAALDIIEEKPVQMHFGALRPSPGRRPRSPVDLKAPRPNTRCWTAPFRRREAGMTRTVSGTCGGEVADVDDNGWSYRTLRAAVRPQGIGGVRVGRLGIGTVGFLTILISAWGGIIPYVGPAFGYSADGTGAWHWALAHTVLALIPGMIGVLVGVFILGETRGVTAGRGRMSLTMAGLLGVFAEHGSSSALCLAGHHDEQCVLHGCVASA